MIFGQSKDAEMSTGILWFDNSTTPLKEKIEKAVTYYQFRYHVSPNLCLVHPSMVIDGVEVPGIEIKKYRPVLPGHIWLGVEAR